MTSLDLPPTILRILEQCGVVLNDLLTIVNEVQQKDPDFAQGAAVIVNFLTTQLAQHFSPEAALAMAESITAQITGKVLGYDPDHGLDA